MIENRIAGKVALITGATAGIGAQIARDLAKLGVNLILTGRRQERLELMKQELASQAVSVTTLCFDVRDTEKASQLLKDDLLQRIDILINNAGLALGLDPVHKASYTDWETMIDTNVKGLLFISRLVTPFMVTKKSGFIVNLGSVAGHEAYPGGIGYNATKFAVHAITKAMKMDLAGTGIRVGMVSPGAVETEFSEIRFKGDVNRAQSVYAGIEPLTAVDISEIVVFMLNRPEHVNIMDVLVYPTAQSSATQISRKG